MKYKKQTIETTMESLFDKDYKSHIKVGKTYWVLFDESSDIARMTNQCGHILKTTFYRSGYWFYKIVGFDDISEKAFHEDSLLPCLMYPTELNPKRELPEFANRAYAEQKYRFNDTHTKIIDWDNSEFIETDIDLDSIFPVK